MVSYYDWTPVRGAIPVATKRQAVPAWNPPPNVFGESLFPHTGSGHPDLSPPVMPLTITGCSPSSGSASGGFTITVTGTGFTDSLEFFLASDLEGSNTTYPDSQTIVSDTELTATWDADSIYPTPMAYFLGGWGDTVVYSDIKMFTTTP